MSDIAADKGGPARQFRAGTLIVAGLGCVEDRLAGELAALGARRVAVVYDAGFAAAGLLEPVLAAAGEVELHLCDPVGVDPDIATAERLAEAAVEAGADSVLAIGGGSALCAAKAVAIRLRNAAPLEAYAGVGNLPHAPAPTVAVPTTAGSGSEVSTVVVLHDERLDQHLVIRGEGYEPEVALLDGTLLRGLPDAPLLYAALDALSHAYEALWARGASRFTDAMALAAAPQIRDALPVALEDRTDAALQTLIEASAMANLAGGNARLALIHALTSAPDVHLPHGYQNGVLLPHVAAFNEPSLPEPARREIAHLPRLLERVGFEPRFAPDELDDEGAASMVAAALQNPFTANNLRPADAADLRGLLAAARG
ncbi:MAG TPA: iron-containing alcohol dehydrogenase [Solirubrobacterales bacterium]|nr:iron-containing alcohol dehydrogenase [Solirubrobacterales bacterium]